MSSIRILYKHVHHKGPWSYGSWIYNYICNWCLSPLVLWVRISIRAMCTTLFDNVCQWFATGRCFSPGPPVSSTNKTDRYDITEILLKVALNTIKQTNVHYILYLIRIHDFAMVVVWVYNIYLTHRLKKSLKIPKGKSVSEIRQSKKDGQCNVQRINKYNARYSAILILCNRLIC
jgi:hypothetical protein